MGFKQFFLGFFETQLYGLKVLVMFLTKLWHFKQLAKKHVNLS
jgi:hypothetical protein